MDDDRERERGGGLELPLEERPLNIARSPIVEVVEADLADGDRHGVTEKLDELVDRGGSRASRLMRIDPEGREDAFLGLANRERRPARGDPRARS